MKVALTGPMATGKSTVFEVFKTRGWQVASMDELRREIFFSEEGQDFQRPFFGGNRPTRDEHRAKYAGDIEFKKTWDGYVLKLSLARLAERMAAMPQANWLVEDPMLMEEGRKGNFERIIVLKSDRATRLTRWTATGRSAENFEKLERYLKPEAEKEAAADCVVNNNGTLEQLKAAANDVAAQLEQVALASQARLGNGFPWVG